MDQISFIAFMPLLEPRLEFLLLLTGTFPKNLVEKVVRLNAFLVVGPDDVDQRLVHVRIRIKLIDHPKVV